MQDSHRIKILSNVDQLAKATIYINLRDSCLSQGLLSKTMVAEIEKHQENEEEKCKRMLRKITKRGPDAFELLCKIWGLGSQPYTILFPHWQSNIGLMQDVKRCATFQPLATSHGSQLAPFLDEVRPLKDFVVKKSTQFHRLDKLSQYNMESKNRGVLFLVNIVNFKGKEPRNGAYVDRANMIHLFREMGFTIFYYEDINWEDLDRLLNELVVSDHLRHTDCFVFGIMTHGTMIEGTEIVEFADHEIRVELILHKFYNTNCRLLLRKPKVFIMPFCRGGRSDTGVSLHRDNGVETDSCSGGKGLAVNPKGNIHSKSDIIICYATVPEFQALRDPNRGSWYIQNLCEVFAEHAHDTDLETMLKLITARVMEWRNEDNSVQTPATSSWGFGKALFFNPGFPGP